jgi:hypothetical protein
MDFDNTGGDDFFNSDGIVAIMEFSRDIDDHFEPEGIIGL